MSNTFLPPDPIKDQSNKWRNVLSAGILFLGIGIAASIKFIQITPEQAEFARQLLPKTLVIPETETQTGGDITVAPPKIQEPQRPELIGEMLPEETFTAASMVVKDRETGALLYSKNPYQARPIASITKLMSALVLLEKDIDWSTTTEVIGADSLDTHMYAFDSYTLQELWDAALIGSSNKAIKTLANALDWPEEAFIERMNQKALELGMSNTRFADPTGLDDENVSTASDVSILLDEALTKQKIKETIIKKELTLYSRERRKSHHIWNTDWLLLGWIQHKFFNLSGGKTGYTPAAGYNFAVQIGDEAEHWLNVVVLGADRHEARFTEARDIAKWVFENYRWPEDED
ncbi:MAG: hypothetical protein WC862_00490 [Patescibacteria group bacterium]